MSPITIDNEKRIKLVVGKIHNLPTPPIVFTQITRVINNPDTSAYEIAAIISEDPALTAKVLKLTNSSFYGIPRTITNVKQAIVILGLEAIKSLVISASVFDMFSKNSKLDIIYLERFWRHSLSVALMSKIICRKKKLPSLQEAELTFSAGLLHDIGKLIIISHLPREHEKIAQLLESDRRCPEYHAENEILGFTHADIGSYLGAKWNLPESICKAILSHHNSEGVLSEESTASIHLANHLAYQMENDDGHSPENLSPFYEVVWDRLEMDPESGKQLIKMLKEEYTKAETFMKMAQGTS
jgi:putative nucleotidyltransferase with HDIG domain